MRELPLYRTPTSTYRLQFTRDFRFPDAAALAPYLCALGISECYASPILAARPGSPHGYDVCDHSRLNPDLGTEDDFYNFCAALRAQNLGLIVDFVPNHMSNDTRHNRWWRDVLANGPSSASSKTGSSCRFSATSMGRFLRAATSGSCLRTAISRSTISTKTCL
jgi:maltooligosyltrehalose synthase